MLSMVAIRLCHKKRGSPGLASLAHLSRRLSRKSDGLEELGAAEQQYSTAPFSSPLSLAATLHFFTTYNYRANFLEINPGFSLTHSMS